MSAYIVDPKVIARLAVYRCTDRYNVPQYDKAAAHTFADILIKENIKSIAYRYPDTEGKEIESFFANATEESYRAAVREHLDSAHVQMPTMKQVAKDAPEYDYQACEHPDYEKSLAHETIQWINARFVRQFRDLEHS